MSNSHTARKPRRASPWLKAAILYAATWATTTAAGVFWLPDVESIFSCAALWGGLAYSGPLMTILTAHELGHFFQARRHGVVASPPYFIPLPLPPFGTMGAVINMTGRVPNLRALFDVGVTGPLAGLAATLVFLFIGLSRSSLVEAAPIDAETMVFGEPLIFRWASQFFFDRSNPALELAVHPTAAAAWTGLFLTSLNLFPVGQLDGGHVFYALLPRRAVYFYHAFLGGVAFYIAAFQAWHWILMTALVAIFGLRHPPTIDDSIPLDWRRKAIGWAALAFIIVGFTPNPIDVQTPPELADAQVVETAPDAARTPD